MANASGPATEGLIAADFKHDASGVHYRVFEQSGQAWLSYERDDPNRELKGKDELRFFLGSGKRGRTYLFERQGYWFEAPINWYAKKQMWDMTPNYLEAREAPLTLAVDRGCLHCHASGVSLAEPDARNHYAGDPFVQGGITCDACHGDSSAHVASGGTVRMIDVDRLQPARRDSICLNCHLEGQVMVVREGKDLGAFQPGDDLADFAVAFNHAEERGSGGRATSQWEALLRSECKRKSGDRLTCTTCHDPHGSPAPEERVAFYRQKCLQCHESQATGHHAENPDCTQCHMARPPSNDIAHEQVTDHWIQMRVSQKRLPLVTTGKLEAVGDAPVTDRDLGMAYAQMAARGDRPAAHSALEFLTHAEKLAKGADGDHELHAQLGFLYQIGGQTAEATAQYRRALQSESFDSLAEGDLGLIEAQAHHFADAEKLWAATFEHNPNQTGAGLNLAVMECGNGSREAALRTLGQIMNFSPDNDRARKMLAEIHGDPRRCVTSAGTSQR